MTVVFLFLITLTLLCMSVPLAILIASRNTNLLMLDRQADTEHFAQLTGTVKPNAWPRSIIEELQRYQSVYEIRALVVARNGVVVASSAGLSLSSQERETATTALFGGQATSTEIIWPWDTQPFIIAIPIFWYGESVGAALTISPTSEVRARTIDQWIVLVFGGVCVMATARIIVGPVTHWILRPVRNLHHAATAIASGELAARADPYSGPPELRSLAENFNTMGDTIERLIARQRAFTSYASHQLRTPLAVLRLHLEEVGFAHPSVAKDLIISLEEVDRLSSVCHGLLAFGRAEIESVVLCLEDAGAVAADRVSAWRSFAQRRDMSLGCTGEGSLMAESTLGMLSQVLDALIENAIKFGHPGGTVTVHVAADDEWVEIRVVDDGPGMVAEARVRATEPFWRDCKNKSIAGTGLGLTICATLVAQVNGEFELLEARPRGLEARIRLRRPTALPDEYTPTWLGEP